jgi:hypothetical protein
LLPQAELTRVEILERIRAHFETRAGTAIEDEETGLDSEQDQ